MQSKSMAFATLLASGYLMTAAPVQAEMDGFVQGAKTHAREAQADWFATYAKEVEQVQKQAGYLGPELPIPQAQKVQDGVYTVVGSFIWGTRENFGLNNNLTAVMFDDGVFVYNAGPNPAVAYSFHQQIKRLTDKPVKWLAVENNQGHAYLGSSYWWDVGVRNLYSQQLANENWHRDFAEDKARYAAARGKSITQSARDVTEHFTTFEEQKVIDMGGGETVELHNFGGGHTASMTGAYVPSRNLLFTGDLGFNERLPGLLHGSNVLEWMASFERMMETVPDDVTVIPGHGTPTDMATLKTRTYDYLAHLVEKVQAVIDSGGDAHAAQQIDQSEYADRVVFEQLAKPNALSVYETLTAKSQN
jgi:glyoxylase-like metal-dependent hydrolase (beta-lactamase superfamily II)